MTARINPSDSGVDFTLIVKSRNTASSSFFSVLSCVVLLGYVSYIPKELVLIRKQLLFLITGQHKVGRVWELFSLWLQMVIHHRSYQSNLGNMAINGIRTPKTYHNL